MSFKLWFSPSKVRSSSHRAIGPRRPQSLHRLLTLEALEDRTVPSGFASNLHDLPLQANLGLSSYLNPVSALHSQADNASALARSSSNASSFLIFPSFSFTITFSETQSNQANVATANSNVSVSLKIVLDETIINSLISANAVSSQATSGNGQTSTGSSSASAASATSTAFLNTLSTVPRVITTVSAAGSGFTSSADFLGLLSSRNQQSSTNDNQRDLRQSLVLTSPTQQVIIPLSSTSSTPTRGGFGQEEYLPLTILDSPLSSYDLGIDDALGTQESAPAVDGLGVSILDQLFREWPPTTVSPNLEVRPLPANNGQVENQVGPQSQQSGGSEVVVVPAPAQNLMDDGPLTKTGSNESHTPGAALRGGSTPLIAEPIDDSTWTATLNAEQTEGVSASLALLALAYPVGRELRAKQDRRPGL